MHSYIRRFSRRRATVTRTLRFAPVLIGGLLALHASPVMAQATTTTAQTPAATPQTPAADAATTYMLTRVFKTGDADHYKLKVHSVQSDSKSPGQDIKFDMRFKESVKEVKGDGSVTLTDEFDKAVANINDQEMDLSSSMPKVTQTLDKTGTLVDVATDGGQEIINSGISQLFQTMGRAQQGFHPQQPMKVGDTWKVELKNSKDDSDKSTGTATLVGLETVGGIQTVKIKMITDSKSKLPDPNAPTSGTKIDVATHFEGSGNFDPKTGKLIKLSGKGEAKMPMGKATIETDLALVTGADDVKPDAAKPADKKP
jgi:hypothetical protein